LPELTTERSKAMARSFAGAGTALVTPFTRSGDVDEPRCGGW
jgi:hypothetical protein